MTANLEQRDRNVAVSLRETSAVKRGGGSTHMIFSAPAWADLAERDRNIVAVSLRETGRGLIGGLKLTPDSYAGFY